MKFIRALYAIVLEIFAFAFVVLFYLFDQKKYDPKEKLSGPQTPVLLVHGYLHNSSGWWLMRSRLIRAGISPVFTVNLGSPFHRIEDYLKVLSDRIAQVQQITGAKQITLVGHSMGGLICCWYAARNKSSVRGVVTIASPMEGSELARIAFSRAGRQMIPGDKLLEQIKIEVKESDGVPFVHVGSTGDEMVLPNRSQFPHWTSEAKHIHVGVMGHLAHIISIRTFRAVLHALNSFNA